MNPLFFLFVLIVLASAAARSQAADMIEIEAHFVKATPEEIQKSTLGGLEGEFGRLEFPEPPLPASFSEPSPVRILSVLGVFSTNKEDSFPKGLLEKVISNPKIVTLTGQRATIENVRELRYPSEFSKPSREDEGPTPVAFETRNVGITIEFEPTLGPDGETIDLIVCPKIVTFLGFVDYSSVKPGEQVSGAAIQEMLGKPLKGAGVWQPLFQSREVTTEATLYSGGMLLLGEMIGPGKNGEKPDPHTARYYVFITAKKLPRK